MANKRHEQKIRKICQHILEHGLSSEVCDRWKEVYFQDGLKGIANKLWSLQTPYYSLCDVSHMTFHRGTSKESCFCGAADANDLVREVVLDVLIQYHLERKEAEQEQVRITKLLQEKFAESMDEVLP